MPRPGPACPGTAKARLSHSTSGPAGPGPAVRRAYAAGPVPRAGSRHRPYPCAVPSRKPGASCKARCAAARGGCARPARRGTRSGGSPRSRHRGIAGEARPGLVLIRAPEGDPDPGRRLTALRFTHRASPYSASPDCVATTHSSPLATSALGIPGDPRAPASFVQQQIQPDDAQEPEDASENREAVQVPLNYGR